MQDLDPRRQGLWDLHDFGQGRGLEIGPLHDAIVRKEQADVRYVDIQDQAGLRAYYQDHPGIPIDNIPEIDYPLTQPDGRIVSLVEACKSGAPFDWVVASHVVEHVPDLIGWLGELAEVVVDGGALVLVVPDRRYCFDVHRPPTSVGAMLEAHLLGAVRPSVRAVYDHYSRVVQYSAPDLWNGVVPGYDARYHGLDETQVLVAKSLDSYVDCHVWLFTPDSFVEQLHELRTIDRTDWYVDEITPTLSGQIEFMVRLRRIPRGQDRTAEQPGELVPTATLPEWLAEQGHARAQLALVEAELHSARREVRRLGRRLARRGAAVAKVRRRLVGQRKKIQRLRRRAERAEAQVDRLNRSWRVGVRAAARRALPGRGGRPTGR